jgi:hypothetical protein
MPGLPHGITSLTRVPSPLQADECASSSKSALTPRSSSLTSVYPPAVAYVLTSSLGGAIVQVVLASRYWVLSKNVVACLLIAVCWVAHIGGGIVSAVWIARFPGYDQRGKLTVPVTIYLSKPRYLVLGVRQKG